MLPTSSSSWIGTTVIQRSLLWTNNKKQTVQRSFHSSSPVYIGLPQYSPDKPRPMEDGKEGNKSIKCCSLLFFSPLFFVPPSPFKRLYVGQGRRSRSQGPLVDRGCARDAPHAKLLFSTQSDPQLPL